MLLALDPGRRIASNESVLGGHLRLFVELAKVPRVGVHDGEPATNGLDELHALAQLAARDDFNTLLGEWLETKANVLVHSWLRCRPSEPIDEDLAAMMALPPGLPDMDFHHDLRLPADRWVRHQTNDYTVHPKAVGRRVREGHDDASVVVTLGVEGPPRAGAGQRRRAHRPRP